MPDVEAGCVVGIADVDEVAGGVVLPDMPVVEVPDVPDVFAAPDMPVVGMGEAHRTCSARSLRATRQLRTACRGRFMPALLLPA